MYLKLGKLMMNTSKKWRSNSILRVLHINYMDVKQLYYKHNLCALFRTYGWIVWMHRKTSKNQLIYQIINQSINHQTFFLTRCSTVVTSEKMVVIFVTSTIDLFLTSFSFQVEPPSWKPAATSGAILKGERTKRRSIGFG